MVFGITDVQFETLERQSTTQRQTSTVATLSFAVADFHLRGASEVIAGCQVDILAKQYIGTDG